MTILGSNSKTKNLQVLLVLVTFFLIEWVLYLVFMIIPNEATMGPVQRIFFFHVGSAIASYCSFGLVLIASLSFLGTRSAKMDALNEAAGEVGFLFCTITLLSGMIWGHAAWNTWFSWEPRLVTFLLLWIIFLAFNCLRAFGDPEKIAAHSAVLGIVGTLTVPIMVFSIKLLPEIAQLHPVVVEKGGLDQAYKGAFFLSLLALVIFQFILVWFRARVGFLKKAI